MSSKVKSPFQFDSANADQRAGTAIPAGTYYGTGYKQKVGRLRGFSAPDVQAATNKQMKTPPTSVV